MWLPRGSGGGAAAAVRRRGVGPAPTPVVAAVCMAGAAPRSGRPSSGETGACRRLHILEGLRMAGRARPCSSETARTPWSLPLRGVRKAVGGLMWPMGGRHAAETEAVAVAGQEPAHRTARRPLLRPQTPKPGPEDPSSGSPTRPAAANPTRPRDFGGQVQVQGPVERPLEPAPPSFARTTAHATERPPTPTTAAFSVRCACPQVRGTGSGPNERRAPRDGRQEGKSRLGAPRGRGAEAAWSGDQSTRAFGRAILT